MFRCVSCCCFILLFRSLFVSLCALSSPPLAAAAAGLEQKRRKRREQPNNRSGRALKAEGADCRGEGTGNSPHRAHSTAQNKTETDRRQEEGRDKERKGKREIGKLQNKKGATCVFRSNPSHRHPPLLTVFSFSSRVIPPPPLSCTHLIKFFFSFLSCFLFVIDRIVHLYLISYPFQKKPLLF